MPTENDLTEREADRLARRQRSDNSTGWFVGIIVALALLAIAYLVFSANTQPSTTDGYRGSAVLVELNGGHGSGVYIGDGFILTAAHVADGLSTVAVKTQGGGMYSAQVLWGSLKQGGYDVGMLYAEALRDLPASALPAAQMTCADAQVGDEVSVTGNPWDTQFATSWGRVSALGITGLEDSLGQFSWSDLTTLDVTAAPGVSGGPVFNVNGQVTGLLVAGMVTPRGNFNYAYMVPGSVICRMLGRT